MNGAGVEAADDISFCIRAETDGTRRAMHLV